MKITLNLKWRFMNPLNGQPLSGQLYMTNKQVQEKYHIDVHFDLYVLPNTETEKYQLDIENILPTLNLGVAFYEKNKALISIINTGTNHIPHEDPLKVSSIANVNKVYAQIFNHFLSKGFYIKPC